MLLSNGLILTLLVSLECGAYVHLRTAKYKAAAARKLIFEPWPATDSAKSAKLLEGVLQKHADLRAVSEQTAYKRAQGAGPWPQPAKRRRKRLIVN